MSELDTMQLQQEWEKLHRDSLQRDLTKPELKRAIELCRVLRQTNTGPARKKRTSRIPLTNEALDALLKG